MAKPASKTDKKEQKNKLLDKMRANPKGDWTIGDVETVSNRLGIVCKSGSSGSHYVAASIHLDGHCTIPAHRPIKAIYIKQFVAMCDAHIAASGATDG